jgi:hypothetical protein
VPPDGTDAPCSDTSNDPHNCGACGHDCQGGSCANGTCQACVLVPQGSVYSIAIDDTDLYFSTEVYGNPPSTSYSSVAKVPLTGGTVTTLASGLQSAETIAVDATTVYFLQSSGTTSGSVQSLPLTGGTPTTLATFSSSFPSGMVLDVQSLYVTLYTASNSVVAAGSHSVVVVPTNGGPVRPLVSGAWLLGEHDAIVYLLAQGSTLEMMSATGGTTMPIASLPDPVAMAFFGADIYVVNGMIKNDYDGSIVKIPIGGGTQTPMATGLSQPVDLAVDATGIYWGQNNELLRLTAGSQGVIYTSPKQSQENVHVDAHAIYWVDTTSGPSTASIMKLAK